MRKSRIKNLSRIIILLVVFALVFGSCAILIPPANSENGATGITETGIDSAPAAWVNLNPSAPPPPRVGHTMADLPGRNLAILFGGCSGSAVYADTWEFHYDTNTWTNRNALNFPPPLTGQGMVYASDLDKVILFGGSGDGLTTTSTQTWCYDYNSNSWTALNASNPPPPRAVPGMIYDPVHHKVILFGGRSSFPPEGDSLGDCWSYDLASNAWTNLNPTSAPTAREAVGMVWVSEWNRALLFGGHNGGIPGTFFNETWVYNPETNQWSSLNPSGSKPAGRFGGSMIYAPDLGKAVLFGGLIPSYFSPDLNDTWTYDHIANSWVNLNPANPPPPRQAGAMVYDQGGGRVVIFGGHSGLDPGTFRNDTWALSLADPPAIGYSPLSLTFSATPGGTDPNSKTLSLWNAGGKTLNWTVAGSANWLTFSPSTGTNTVNVQVGAHIAGMAAGTYTATLTIQAPGAGNSPQAVPVILNVRSLGFGLDYSLLSGWNMISVPVVLQDPRPDAVFPSGWPLFSWDAKQGRYLQRSEITLAIGRGYWLKVPFTQPITISGLPNDTVLSSIPLFPSWNLIGTPYHQAVAWSSVSVSKGDETKSLDAAFSAGWIKGPFYRWTGNAYELISSGGTFQPTSGYWLKGLQEGCALVFTKP